MRMVRVASRLWDLVKTTPRIDARALARAIEDTACEAGDFRTRLLIRDSLRALESHWGAARFAAWLSASPHEAQIRKISDAVDREADDEHGFPSIKRRIMDALDAETIFQFLRDLSQKVTKPTRIVIGGSVALIL